MPVVIVGDQGGPPAREKGSAGGGGKSVAVAFVAEPGAPSEATGSCRLSQVEVDGGPGGPAARKVIKAGSQQLVRFQPVPADVKPMCKTISRRIIENNFFVCFTMLLTIYALVADDFRLVATNKSTDGVFDYMVCLCIVVFGIECILSIPGKADYFWSFFFWLDVISTVSLVLDISIVADSLLASQGGQGQEVRSGRAAKIGAKAGRVVRVLRLVRILKLYKAWHDAKALKEKKQKSSITPGDDDDWDDEDSNGEEDFDKIGQESHVGRKLSEMTTRRVICIIMAMMLGLQFLSVEDTDMAAFASLYGAEVVWEKWKLLEEHQGMHDELTYRSRYETSMLKFIHYHNWFARADAVKYCPMQGCSDAYYAQLFWVGFMGKNMDKVRTNAYNASIRTMSVQSFEDHYAKVDGLFNYGYMPKETHSILESSWGTVCDMSETLPGFMAQGASFLNMTTSDKAIRNLISLNVECPSTLRKQEYLIVSPRKMTQADLEDVHIACIFDLRPYTREDAVYGIINTFIILVLLVAVSMVFTNDANRLIVHPVERMIKRVESIRDDPLKAITMADEDFIEEERAKAKKRRARENIVWYVLGELISCRFFGSAGNDQPMETVILEKTIIKLGSLLALGFGEAGANIIGHNMKGTNAGVNAMIPGVRVECVIGVARICAFGTATEVLQSKIMTFVNQIAEVVHGVANEFQGAPNRNSGESFLVIWRIESAADATLDPITQQAKKKMGAKMAGLSVVAFAKILGGLHRSTVLASYRQHPGLQYRLGSNCRVNLSFGLHAGWAIEGAVGSEFKIDASYLSPNVSIATSMEKATQTYGVSLMVAQSVIEKCPKSLVSKCRLIDKCRITGSPNPMEIYCVDLDWRRVTVDNDKPLGIVWNTRHRFKVRQFLREEKHRRMESGDFDVLKLFEEDQAIAIMREPFKDEFFQLFNMGYQNYSQGEWQVARRMLSCVCRSLNREDGPSSALLRFMEQSKFEAPKDWLGIRDLITSGAESDCLSAQ